MEFSTRNDGSRAVPTRTQPVLPEQEILWRSADPLADIFRLFQLHLVRDSSSKQAAPDVLPLPGHMVRGKCDTSSRFTAAVLQAVGGVPEDKIIGHQLISAAERAGYSGASSHYFLYLQDAHLLYPGLDGCDMLYDGTSRQFAPYPHDTSYPYCMFNFLRSLPGAEAGQIANDLTSKGYVTVPHGERGDSVLTTLMMAYIPRDCRPTAALPVNRDLFAKPTHYVLDILQGRPLEWLIEGGYCESREELLGQLASVRNGL